MSNPTDLYELICCSCYTQGGMEMYATGPGTFLCRCRQCGAKYAPENLRRWKKDELPMLQTASGQGIIIHQYMIPQFVQTQ